MDNSTLARAIALKKLEILPPGQAAMSIMPNAILACGFVTEIRRYVRKGSRIHCATKPVSRDLGALSILRNSDFFKSNAIPNIIIAKQILSISTVDALKLRMTWSIFFTGGR